MSTDNTGSINYFFELIKVILNSWPLFFMIVILMFKKYINDFLNEVIKKIKHIKNFKIKDLEATIDSTIEENKTSSNKLNIEDDYKELPAYIQFILSWIKFESNIRSYYKNNNYNRNNSIIQLLKPLVREAITEQEYRVLIEINKYRNTLFHENYTNVSDEENYKFIDFLEALTSKIDNFKERNNAK